jgi:hypothetical protein
MVLSSKSLKVLLHPEERKATKSEELKWRCTIPLTPPLEPIIMLFIGDKLGENSIWQETLKYAMEFGI